MKLHHWFFNGKSHAFFQIEDIEFVPSLDMPWQKVVHCVGPDQDIIIESYRPYTLQVEVISSTNAESACFPELAIVGHQKHVLHPQTESKWLSTHFLQEDNIHLQVSNGLEQTVCPIDDHVSLLLCEDRFCGISSVAPLELCKELYRKYVF